MNPADEIRRLEGLADLMDSRFRIPGTGIRFGLDSVIGLVPGAGDLVTLLPASWLIARASKLGAPPHILIGMVINVVIDLLIGAIPLIGDLFDVGFKSNRRNVRLLRRYLERQGYYLGED